MHTVYLLASFAILATYLNSMYNPHQQYRRHLSPPEPPPLQPTIPTRIQPKPWWETKDQDESKKYNPSNPEQMKRQLAAEDRAAAMQHPGVQMVKGAIF